jgi:thiol-disulfide isomerase/thioredoxin
MNRKLFKAVLLGLCLWAVVCPAQKSLTVGDTLPLELWNLPLQVVNHPEGKTTITLADYKDKLIILDFWATWCSPCVAMLPKQDSLQKLFKDQLQILPVTYQTKAEVSDFIDKYEKRKSIKLKLPFVINEKPFHIAFPHTTIPHYVWIGRDGTVKAITGHEEVTVDKIKKILSDSKATLPTKSDPPQIAFNKSAPFLVAGNGGDGKNMIYHSVLTSYTAGLPDGFSIRFDSLKNGILTLLNVPLKWNYRLGYGADSVWFGDNRIEFKMINPQKIMYTDTTETYEEWKSQYSFCYQLILPKTSRQALFTTMVRDLERMFPNISATIEKREKLCWVLSCTDKTKIPIATDGKFYAQNGIDGYTLRNAALKNFVTDMNMFTLQKSPFPLINESGVTEKLNLDITAKLNDLASVSAELEKYGLKITQEYRTINVLVFRDKAL